MHTRFSKTLRKENNMMMLGHIMGVNNNHLRNHGGKQEMLRKMKNGQEINARSGKSFFLINKNQVLKISEDHRRNSDKQLRK